MPHAFTWSRFEAAVAACRGALIAIPPGASCPLYDAPSDPRREAAMMPPESTLLARWPASYAAFAAERGFQLVSVPAPLRSFAFLPPRAAAQLTRATGEFNRPWKEVAAERERGHGRFDWVMFAAWSLAEVHGWAFGPSAEGDRLHVWTVEDGAPVADEGTFEQWFAERTRRLEHAAALRPQTVASLDDDGGYDDDDDDDDRPTSLNEL